MARLGRVCEARHWVRPRIGKGKRYRPSVAKDQAVALIHNVSHPASAVRPNQLITFDINGMARRLGAQRARVVNEEDLPNPLVPAGTEVLRTCTAHLVVCSWIP